MNIELTKEEIEILDTALVEWQNAPTRDGFSHAIFGALLNRDLGLDEMKKKAIADKAIADKAEVDKTVRQRELKAMRLDQNRISSLVRAA